MSTRTGSLDLQLAVPAELGGSPISSTPSSNPEELLAAGFAASFHDAIHHAVEKSNPPEGVQVNALVEAFVDIVEGPDGKDASSLDVAVRLRVHFESDPPAPNPLVQTLLQKARATCLFSRMMQEHLLFVTITTPSGMWRMDVGPVH